MPPHGVVSADSHVTEPADLWKQRLDQRYRDRAPHVIKNPDEGPAWLFVAENMTPFPVAGGFAAGRSGEALKEFQDKGYESARPSGWDPVARIEDQELDGIDAEILYPTLAMKIFAMSDPELQRACFLAYTIGSPNTVPTRRAASTESACSRSKTSSSPSRTSR